MHSSISRLRAGSSRAALAGALAASALVPAAAAVPAHAAIGTATCGGSQTVAYSPGLTDRPRDVTVNGTSTLSRCASSADPAITAGRSTFHATGRLSCTAGHYSGTRQVTWNNDRTSTMSFSSVISVSGRESVVAVKGTVTDGEFRGQRWSAVFTMFSSRPAACDTPGGLPTASGRLLLAIGSLVPGMPVPERSRPSRQ